MAAWGSQQIVGRRSHQALNLHSQKLRGGPVNGHDDPSAIAEQHGIRHRLEQSEDERGYRAPWLV